MMDKFKETYKKNAEKMQIAKAMYEAAMKRGDVKTARKYRAEYLDLKSEIDMYAIQIIK